MEENNIELILNKKTVVKKGDEIILFDHIAGVFLKAAISEITKYDLKAIAFEVFDIINEKADTPSLMNKEYRLNRYSYKNDNITYYDDIWCFSNNTRFLKDAKAKALKYFNERHRSNQKEKKLYAERRHDLEAIKKIVENGYNIFIYGESGLVKLKVDIKYEEWHDRYYCISVDQNYCYPMPLKNYGKSFFTDEDEFYKNHNHYRRERSKIIENKKIFSNDTVSIYQLKTDHITLIKTNGGWVFNRPASEKKPAMSLTVSDKELFTRCNEITSFVDSLLVELKEMFS